MRYKILVEIAKGNHTHREIAEHYGVTTSSVHMLSHRYPGMLADIRRDLQAGLREKCAGLWIADQEQRMAARQRMLQLIEQRMASRAEAGEYVPASLIQHYETILRNAAEEFGEIPDRPAAPKSTETVEYTVNVSTEDLT